MIRKFLRGIMVLFIIGAFISTSYGGEKDDVENLDLGLEEYRGGGIAFDIKEWDYGYAPRNSLVKHIFTIKNIGDDTLRITKIKPGCGCISAPLRKNSLAPGDSTELLVGFKTLKFSGSVKKNIRITSSDPKKQVSQIAFTAIVNKPHPSLKVEPEIVNFVQVRKGKAAKQKIRLTNTSKFQMTLDLIDIPEGEDFKCKLKRTSLLPGKSTELEIELSRHAELGLIQESVTLQIQGSGLSRLSIPIKGEISSKN